MDEFGELLVEVVTRVDKMPAAERERWRELLWYIHALVYHMREPPERPGLHKLVAVASQTPEHKQEVEAMPRTIADELKEEGALRSMQETLTRQLQKRFGKVPPTTKARIKAETDPKQLRQWLDAVVVVKALEDVGIGRPAGG